jgi:DNA-binding MarR family transcriptional regulator
MMMEPSEDPTSRRTAEALLDVLHGVHRLMRASLHTGDHEAHAAEPGGLAFPEKRGQFKLLIVLTKRGRSSMQELAAALDVTPPTVTGMVRRLLEQGYVERARDDADWRTVWVELTEQGREVVTRHHRERVEALERRIAQLGPEERERLRAAIPVLARLLEIEPGAASPPQPDHAASDSSGARTRSGRPCRSGHDKDATPRPRPHGRGNGSKSDGGRTTPIARAEEREDDAGDA